MQTNTKNRRLCITRIAHTISRLSLTAMLGLTLSGCLHFNYAVKKEDSPIPYNNQYFYEGHQIPEYEFSSTLYRLDKEIKHENHVEIMHLNDISNNNNAHLTPNNIWRKSRLDFYFAKDSNVELIEESVVLAHYSTDGKRYEPLKRVSNLEGCIGTTDCAKSLVLHYGAGMPNNIIEKVSFTLVVNGKEEHIAYTIPLEYKYEYSYLTMLMSV